MKLLVQFVVVFVGLLSYGAAKGLHFTTQSCKALSNTPSYVEMVDLGGSWPTAGFCKTTVDKKVPGTGYSISVKLYNHEGFSGRTPVGHPGIMYNVVDMNNFDFVYFRPHSSSGCFQTGYVKNGAIKTVLSSTCPGGPPPNKSWFQVKVEIQGRSVRIYKAGQLIRTITSHFAALGRGGVLVANGYRNTIRFKEFKVSPSYPYPTASCTAVSKTASYVEMVAHAGPWPKAGFCRALVDKKVPGTSYSISVKLYNVEGIKRIGHLGVMYNVVDMNNFDFVYFRPHSSSGCFQTGYVKNDALKWDTGLSSTCPGGPPPNKSWFQVKVEIQGRSVRIYKAGQLVRTITSHFAALGRGGVLVANGYRNTICFKEFKVSPSYPYPTASCTAVSKTASYVEMFAHAGPWPKAGFCRALVDKKVPGTSYSISVQLYNLEGVNRIGHPGVMYNVVDMNNFDFVYFRPHSSSGCFQTGYVKNGALKWDTGLSSTCPGGPPPNKSWFQVKVEIQGRSVRIYKAGQLVRTITSHFAALGRGGVLVANGYRNTIRFKEFEILV